jgi:hypothetical protein
LVKRLNIVLIFRLIINLSDKSVYRCRKNGLMLMHYNITSAHEILSRDVFEVIIWKRKPQST